MDEEEKAALFYYLTSLTISLSKITGDKEYAEETKKTAGGILSALTKRYEDD